MKMIGAHARFEAGLLGTLDMLEQRTGGPLFV
jgi:hypothetical protein